MNRAGAMHIALFMPSLGGGGAERVSLTLGGAFAGAGHRVSLVVASGEGSLRDMIPSGVEVVDLRAGRVRRAIVPLVTWLRRERPEALLASQVHANIVAFAAHRLSRSSATLVLREDSTPSRNLGGMARVPRFVLQRLMSLAYRSADAVVAVSRDAGADLCAVLERQLDNLVIIYNPVISAALLDLAREEVDHPWLRDRSRPVLVSVGRLSEAKDHSTLLRALAEMRSSPESRLIILGEGPLRPELERLIQQLGLHGRVSMPGFVKNPLAYMAKAAVFVMSSRFEGLPGALIEALACGCQVVSTDCPSGPREILRDGSLGRLVPVGDSDALRRAIEETLTTPVPQPEPSYLERYTERHSMNAYLELIHQM